MPLVIFTPNTNRHWDIKINNVLHSTDTQNIIEYLETHPELSLFIFEAEMGWAIANFGAENQRIELISKVQNPVIEFYSDEQTPINPSAFIRDSSVLACLSVASEPEPEPEPSNYFSPMAVNNAGNVLAGYHSAVGAGNTLQLYAFNGNQLDVSNNLVKVELPPDLIRFAGDDSVIVASVYSDNTENYTLTAVARSLNGEYDLPVSFTTEFKGGSFDYAVNHDGEYIIAARHNEPIQIYQRQTQTSYQKIGEIVGSNFYYFYGLSFSPDGTKIGFYGGGGGGGLVVYSFDAGVTALLGNMEYLAHEAHGTTILALPVWVRNDVLVHSYAWLEDDESTPYKGFLDIIKVDGNGPQLLARNDTLGAKYYIFQPPSQMGNVLFRDDDGRWVLSVDPTGQVEMRSLPVVGDNQFVLLPDGNRVAYGNFSEDQIGVINTIN